LCNPEINAASGGLILAASKRLARPVALVGEEAEAAGAGPAMTRSAGFAGGRCAFLAPQLLEAAADRLEIVGGTRPWHRTLQPRTIPQSAPVANCRKVCCGTKPQGLEAALPPL
jgi:hypothetical protein